MAAAFNATVWIEGGWVKVRWPYDKKRIGNLLEAIKFTIPKEGRQWSPEEKCWLIDPSHDEDLINILDLHCDNVTILGDTTESAARVPDPLAPGGDAASMLIGFCPDKALPKVWRTIAAALHPDSPTGDQDTFIKATQAWEALRASRGI